MPQGSQKTLEVGNGFSTAPGAFAAGMEAARIATASLGQCVPCTVLVSVPAQYDREEVLRGIQTAVEKDIPVFPAAGDERMGGATRKEHVLVTILASCEEGPAADEQLRREIAGRREAEKALRESEAIFRDLTEKSLVGIYIVQDNLFKYVNPTLAAIFGYSVDELLDGMGPVDVVPPEDWPVVRENLRRRQSGETTSIHYDFKGLRKDGVVINVEVFGSLTEFQGKPAVIGTLLDITSRKEAEERLRESEASYRNLFDSITDAIFIQDEAGRFLEVNKGAEDMYGYPQEFFIGKTQEQLAAPDRNDLPAVAEAVRHAFAGTPRVVDFWGRRSDGTVFPQEVRITPATDKGRSVVIAVARDITERKEAEEILKKSEEQYRLLFKSNPNPMWVSDRETLSFLAVNNAAVQSYGYSREEFLRMNIRDIHLPEDREALTVVATTARGGIWKPGVWRHKKKDGTLIDVEITTHDIPFNGRKARLVLAYEVTERKKLEAQLLHSQKMEAVGQLAGGVAHDFNNILTAIIGYGHILHMKMEKDDPLRGNVEHLLESAERAAHLTHSLLAFSRKQIINPQPVDLNEIIQRVDKFLRRIIGEDIELKTALHPKALTVNADSAQIEQVLMNLATNARDAMPRGGSFSIETGIRELDDAFIRTHGYGVQGRYAVVSATDTGSGMDEATRKRIFEPFYTTKEVGKGTGLGLAILYGIVKQHQGYIHVDSEPGRGTTFTISLPLINDEGAASKPVSGLTEERPPRGTETVLVAEDDAILRKLSRTVLEEFGYTVIEAEDGVDAVTKFRENRDRIDLVMLDMIMPKKSGRETYEELRKVRPDVKALFVSGYTADKIRADGLLEKGVELVLKPISPRELLKKVRHILNGRD